MDLSSIPDQWWIDRGPAMFRVIIGGETEWAMLVEHWQGLSLRDIGDRHGVSAPTVSRWIRQSKMRMRQAGFDPEAVRGYADRHPTPTPAGSLPETPS